MQTTLQKSQAPASPADSSPLPVQYVRAEQLLQILFAPEARPSMRWLREQQMTRKIPSVKIGRLVFFDPPAVKAALDARTKGRPA